ncbi:unnamed protein product [Arabidopsis thaliana]|uniref:(thale cress) hypothetical protein n=1 Tax=Arabidopsis thaliana TaxID=3702 RepID=A0A7G2E5A4_ARATH|nr:unnamed protein product [Arabidopsis thaliana]
MSNSILQSSESARFVKLLYVLKSQHLDKLRLIEVCGTSESEFHCDLTSMMDLCFDFFRVSKEKKDLKETKGSKSLVDVLPQKKRRLDDTHLMMSLM